MYLDGGKLQIKARIAGNFHIKWNEMNLMASQNVTCLGWLLLAYVGGRRLQESQG